MIINYLQHVPFEGLGNIENRAKQNNHETKAVRLYAGENLPDIDEVDFLIVLGGPMNVHEEDHFPFLSREKKFIELAIKREIPVLGICLGAQLIADVLGAKVYPNRQKEIGWHPVETNDQSTSPFAQGLPNTFTTFHWHGDTFDLPEGAKHLASTTACRNQAFSYGSKVLGLQFHLEATLESIQLMIEHEGDEIAEEISKGTSEYVQLAERILSPHQADEDNLYNQNAVLMGALFDRLAT